MRKCLFLLTASLISMTVNAQFSVNSTGVVMMDGYQGYFSSAPRISITSPGTLIQGHNTSFMLINTDVTSNNWIRSHFVTFNGSNQLEDFVSLCAQFRNRDNSEKSADFHIATLNQGTYASRFSILSTTNANNVAFHFNTGYTGSDYIGRGIWFDASQSGQPTIRPDSSNYGSIGSPSHYWRDLYVNNAYYFNHGTITSDRRAKENVKAIGNESLEKILKLNAVEYTTKGHVEKKKEGDGTFPDIYGSGGRPNYDSDSDESARALSEQYNREKSKSLHYGFIAQEVEEILPQIVEYNSEYDSYGIRYTELIPYLVAAIKAQQEQIDNLTSEIARLKNPNSIQYAPSTATVVNAQVANLLLEEAVLFPCKPNPSDSYTSIGYQIPMNFNTAILYVYAMSGAVIVEHEITESGYGVYLLDTKNMAEGVYPYSLYVNGMEVGTQKLVVNK